MCCMYVGKQGGRKEERREGEEGRAEGETERRQERLSMKGGKD